MHRRFSRCPVAVALATALAGCALQAPPERSELQKDALAHTIVPAAWKTSGAVTDPVGGGRWTTSFNDPALSALVDEALTHNADLRTAAAVVEQAAGYVKVASAPLLPSVGLAGTWSGASSSGGSGLNGILAAAPT